MSETTLQIEHYTDADPWTLRQTNIKNTLGNKPEGALWCSPVEGEYTWRDWSDEVGYESPGGFRIELVMDLDRCLVVDTRSRLIGLPWMMYPGWDQLHQNPTALDKEIMNMWWGPRYVDWESLVKDGWRSAWVPVYMTGIEIAGPERNLVGYDCDTIVILDHTVIKEYYPCQTCETAKSVDSEAIMALSSNARTPSGDAKSVWAGNGQPA